MPPVSASGTPVKTSSASRDRAEASRTAARRSGASASGTTIAQPLRARDSGSRTGRPTRSSSPAGSVDLGARCAAAASATNEPRSRPRTFACTTTRRLPFSRLTWFGPFAERELARRRRAARSAAAGVACRERDAGPELVRVAAAGSAGARARARSSRSASGRRTTRSKRRSPSKTCPAARAADRRSRRRPARRRRSARSARARSRSISIVSTGRPVDLLDLHVGRARDRARAPSRSRSRCAQQRVEVVAEDLHRDVAAHAGDQLVEAHLDRLRELVVVARHARAAPPRCSRTSSSFGLRGSGHSRARLQDDEARRRRSAASGRSRSRPCRSCAKTSLDLRERARSASLERRVCIATACVEARAGNAQRVQRDVALVEARDELAARAATRPAGRERRAARRAADDRAAARAARSRAPARRRAARRAHDAVLALRDAARAAAARPPPART